MSRIEWDFERMQDVILKLNSTITILETQKDKIENLIEKVNGDWQSMAGIEYAQRINEDLQYIKDTLENYKETRDNLIEARKIYAGCEVNISTKLMSLYSKMSI